jgi:F0F1-type ATP synthase membrane subunit c/vacuolar-type H+-ATPase subunit K
MGAAAELAAAVAVAGIAALFDAMVVGIVASSASSIPRPQSQVRRPLIIILVIAVVPFECLFVEIV